MAWLYACIGSISAHALAFYTISAGSGSAVHSPRYDNIHVAVQLVSRQVTDSGSSNSPSITAMTRPDPLLQEDLSVKSDEAAVINEKIEPTDLTYVDVANINGIKPSYPHRSVRYREEGRVIVSVFQTGDGVRFRVHQSSGHNRLDRAALVSLETFDFTTVRIPEESGLFLAFNFRLSGKDSYK